VTYDLYKKFGEDRLLDTPICGALLLYDNFEGAALSKCAVLSPPERLLCWKQVYAAAG
jgi:hypothetical protein